MNFGVNEPPRRRFPAFTGSIAIHGAALYLLSVEPVSFYVAPTPSQLRPKYSARLLEWKAPNAVVRHIPSPTSEAPAEPNHTGLSRTETSSVADPPPLVEPSAPTRNFEVPAVVKPKPVKQTLVQFDLPPDLALKHEVPVPTMLWTAQLPSQPITETAVPPQKAAETDPHLPQPPALERPNRESAIDDQKIASAQPRENPKLLRMLANNTPIARIGSQMTVEIPQITPTGGRETAISGLISVSNLALQSAVVALPPTNQAAPAGGNSPATGTGTRSASVKIANADAQGTTGGGKDPGEPAPPLEIPGTKRMTRPKDGRFAAVVVGSAGSGPYNEQPSPLQGKVIYTAHIDVGFRKKWILQYSFLNGGGTSNAAVDAPWPLVMVVPTALGALDIDYLMVHGKITADGRLEMPSLTYPDNSDHRDLLFAALGQWEFRPAKQSDLAAVVEILLIIPRQTQ